MVVKQLEDLSENLDEIFSAMGRGDSKLAVRKLVRAQTQVQVLRRQLEYTLRFAVGRPTYIEK